MHHPRMIGLLVKITLSALTYFKHSCYFSCGRHSCCTLLLLILPRQNKARSLILDGSQKIHHVASTPVAVKIMYQHLLSRTSHPMMEQTSGNYMH